MSDNPFGLINPIIDPDNPINSIDPKLKELTMNDLAKKMDTQFEAMEAVLKNLQAKVDQIDDNTKPKISLATVRWNVQVSGIALLSSSNTFQVILSVLVTHSGNVPVPDLTIEHFTFTEHLPMDFSGFFGAVPTPSVKVFPIHSAVWFAESGRGMYQIVSIIPFNPSLPRRLFTILAAKGGSPGGSGMGSVALQTQHPADD